MARPQAPEVGHTFKRCLVCGRNFRRFRSQLKRCGWGRFCSIDCRSAAWHLFSYALSCEKLEPLFQALAAELKAGEWRA
jgi:hypothetical protein